DRSDPETAIAVPQQFVRINLVIGEPPVPIDCVSNGISFDFVAGELHDSSAVQRHQQPSILSSVQANELGPWSIALGRPRPQSPHTGFGAGPERPGAVFVHCPHGPAESAILPRALRAAASYRAEPASAIERRRPHRSLTVFEQRCYELVVERRRLDKPAVPQDYESGKRANPQTAIACDEQAIDVLIGELLTRRWLPGEKANAIEAKQPEFGPEPEIPIGCLGHGVDVAQRKPVPNRPRVVRVLADPQRWAPRESAGSQGEQRPCHDEGGRDQLSSSAPQLSHGSYELV